jgi:hypothetical protein
MPRFVLLHHEMPAGRARPPHWDLMLEFGAALRTWALDEEPQIGRTIAARSLSDHRLEYLTYEGPVSGDRGSVSQWDAGAYELLAESDGKLVVRLAGVRLSAVATLEITAGDDQRWRARFTSE